MKTVSGSAVVLALAVAALSACGSGPADPTTGKRVVHVVAAENMWGNVVAQIGGRHAAVSSIISDPSADPHLYSSNPRDAGRLAQANLVVVNGLGYDDFASKLLAAAPNSKRRVLSVAKVVNPGGHDPNPHLWYDVPRLPAVAGAIATALATEDPGDAGYFRANAARFARSLGPLNATLAVIRSRHPGAPVAYTERVPGYLLQAAGLTIKTPTGFASAIESGSEPAPADAQRLNDLLTGHRVRALLYNSQAVTAVTKRLRALAASSGVPVIAVTETLPLSEPDFQSWQRHQAQALLKALGG
jgi:zinc/manganese transport system substrate-binding protein